MISKNNKSCSKIEDNYLNTDAISKELQYIYNEEGNHFTIKRCLYILINLVLLMGN